jgi:carbonic anhydrase
MCIEQGQPAPHRRRVLALTAANIAVASFWSRRATCAVVPATSITADEAIARLKSGNEKFVTAPQLCALDLLKQRGEVATAQTPWAGVISCSDSRVPPELLFGGLGVGQIFVARNAGNMVDTATMGTIEYGAEHFGIPLFVVMGHSRCGAVAAACAVVEKQEKFPGSVGQMVNAIVPAARAVYGQPGDFVDNAVRESAKRTALGRKVQNAAELCEVGPTLKKPYEHRLVLSA